MKLLEFLKTIAVNDIFVHVRNVSLATLIITAGLYTHVNARHIQLFSVIPTGYLGYIITLIGMALLLLNMIDGVVKLSKLRYNLVFVISLVLFYLIFVIRLVEVLLSFRLHF